MDIDYSYYTDKYFIYTNHILRQEQINPIIAMNVFARGKGKVVGLDQAVDILENYSTIKKDGGEVWITQKEEFQEKDTLMIIKAPAQSFIELETLYLGVLSSALSEALGILPPTDQEVQDKFKKLKEIYQETPIIYFGARHYHYKHDKRIAKIALENGAAQTSTDIGSSNINKSGVGTMPHALILIMAEKYGISNATLMAAKLFDKHIDQSVPRTILVDTFNREITDSLQVANYFQNRPFSVRLDTCGENIGEGVEPYNSNNGKDPTFYKGRGMTIQLVSNLKSALVENGYANNCQIFLSSGFSDENKAKAFMKAHDLYKSQTGNNLFDGVGIGEITPSIFCTADICEVNGMPIYKTGREVHPNYSIMKRVM